MSAASLIKLLILAAIWGGSFIFLRVLAPVLGPPTTACLRVLIAGLLLSAYCRATGVNVGWREHGRHYAVIGGVNSALPFFLYSFAALHIPASLSVILNATSPLFGAVFASMWLGDTLSLRKIVGLLAGIAGVTLVAVKGSLDMGSRGLVASLACLVAAMCYALTGIYIKKRAPNLPPLGIASASQIAAGLLLLPLILAFPIPGPITATVALNMLALSVLCSAIAYVLYYRLIADIGPTRALTVTFLMPIFGLFWSTLFLNETITPQTLAGCALIITGTAQVLRR